MARSADGQKRRRLRVMLSLSAFIVTSSFLCRVFFALKSHHLFYKSDVLCGKYKSMLAVIRKYSPPGEKALPSNTVAYIVAKCHVPASLCVGLVLLEASEITPIHH